MTINPNYNSLPEQVQINANNIEELSIQATKTYNQLVATTESLISETNAVGDKGSITLSNEELSLITASVTNFYKTAIISTKFGVLYPCYWSNEFKLYTIKHPISGGGTFTCPTWYGLLDASTGIITITQIG